MQCFCHNNPTSDAWRWTNGRARLAHHRSGLFVIHVRSSTMGHELTKARKQRRTEHPQHAKRRITHHDGDMIATFDATQPYDNPNATIVSCSTWPVTRRSEDQTASCAEQILTFVPALKQCGKNNQNGSCAEQTNNNCTSMKTMRAKDPKRILRLVSDVLFSPDEKGGRRPRRENCFPSSGPPAVARSPGRRPSIHSEGSKEKTRCRIL